MFKITKTRATVTSGASRLTVIGILWCAVVLGLLSDPAPAAAQSLWQRRDPSKTFLFQDVQARRIGDLITIVVNENTDVANRDQRSLDKRSDNRHGFGFNTSAEAGETALSANLDESFGADSQRSFDGRAAYSSGREFTDRITVPVIDVLPNGNLVIGGRRSVNVQGDQRMLIISGVVRAHDLRADNTIASRYVSNLELRYEADGRERYFTEQSWLSRTVNWLWPF